MSTHNVNIKFNTDIKNLKQAESELKRLRFLIESMKADPNLLGNSQEQLKLTIKTASLLERAIGRANKGSKEAFTSFNRMAQESMLKQIKLSAAHQDQLRTLKAQQNTIQAITKHEDRRLSIANRTKKALGQSFLEAPLYTASFAALAGIGNAITQFIEFDKVMTRIGIVTGRSAKDMQSFAEYANDAGKALGVTGKNFAEASLTFLQQGGLAADYAESLATASIKLANITGTNAADTAEYVTAIANSFGLLEKEGSKAGEHIADMLASLDAASGSSADEIASAFKRSASSFAAAGFSAEQASAMIAVVSETTRQSAEMVGTGFKTMIGNLAEVKAGSDEAEAITNQLQKVSKEFKLNFTITDEETGNMKSVPRILREVSKIYSESTDLAAKNALVEAIAGKEQRDRFIALMNNQERYNELLETAKHSAGQAELANARYLDSVGAKIEQVKNEWEELIQNLISSDVFKGILDQTGAVLANFNAMSEGANGLLRVLTQLGSIALPLAALKLVGSQNFMRRAAVGSFREEGESKFKNIGSLTQGGQERVSALYEERKGLDKSSARYGEITKELGGLQQAADKVARTQKTLSVATAGAAGAFQILNIATQDGLSTNDKLVQSFGAMLPAIGSLLGPWGTLAGIVAQMVLSFVSLDSESTKFMDKIKQSQTTAVESIKGNSEEVDQLVQKVSSLSGNTSSKEYIDAANRLGELLPGLKVGTDAYGNAILDNNQAIKEYVELMKEKALLEKKDESKEQVKTLEKSVKAGKDLAENQEKAIKRLKDKIDKGAYKTQNQYGQIVDEVTEEDIDKYKKKLAKLKADLNVVNQQVISESKAEVIAMAQSELPAEEAGTLSRGFAQLFEMDPEKYNKELQKNGPKAFFKKYKDQMLEVGKEAEKVDKALAKIKTSDTISKNQDEIIKALQKETGLSEEELKKNNIYARLAEAYSEGFDSFDQLTKKQKISDVLGNMTASVNNSMIGMSSSASKAFGNMVTQTVLGTQNQAAAYAKYLEMSMDFANIQTAITEALDGKGITAKEYASIADAAEATPYFKVKGNFKKIKKDGKTYYVQKNNKDAITLEKNAIDAASSAIQTAGGGKLTPTGASGSGSKDSDSFSKRVDKATSLIDKQIDALETKKMYAEDALSKLEPGSQAWINKNNELQALEEQVQKQLKLKLDVVKKIKASREEENDKAKILKGLEKEILDIKNKILAVSKENSKNKYDYDYGKYTAKISDYNAQLSNTIKGTKEYNSILNEVVFNERQRYFTEKARYDFLKKNATTPEEKAEFRALGTQLEQTKNTINELVISGAVDKFNESLYGSSNIEKLQAEYRSMNLLTEDIIDSHEQLIEKTKLQADLQREIENSTDTSYKNNLKILESKLKDTVLTKQNIQALKTQMGLLKSLSEASGRGEMKLTKTSSGKFRYSASKSGDKKAAAIQAASEAEASAIEEYKKLSDELFNVQQEITKAGEGDSKKNLVTLAASIEKQREQQASEVQKAQLVSTLIARGQARMAEKVITGAMTLQDAISSLEPAEQMKLREANNLVLQSVLTSEQLLVNSNNELVKKNGELITSQDGLAGANLNLITGLNKMEEYMKKYTIPTPKVEATIKVVVDAKNIATTINQTAGNGVDIELPQGNGNINTREEVPGSDSGANSAKKAAIQSEIDAKNAEIKKLQSAYASAVEYKQKSIDYYNYLKIEKAKRGQRWTDAELKAFKDAWAEYDAEKSAAHTKANSLRSEISGLEKEIAQLATGGYTGSFDGGKIGILHEKELVLNKMDTQNMLKAINILRDMPQFNTAISFNPTKGSSGANQSIVINAEFPAVSSSDEIKKAFESMSTKALQYAYRTKSY